MSNRTTCGINASLLIVCTNLAITAGLSSSPLVNTRWNILLDIGVLPGTWMPKRHPGWGESGGRLVLNLDVAFTGTPSATSEILVGPKESTFRLEVCEDSQPSKFVSRRGEESVTFESGGWCVGQSNAGEEVGSLAFWLDCPTGAKRNDVEIFPNERIFFTTGVWQSPEAITEADKEYRQVMADLNDMAEKRKGEEDTGNQNLLDKLLSIRKMVADSKELDILQARMRDLKKQLPPPESAVAENGVQIAPTGAMVIKGDPTPAWVPGSEYLIFGKFSTKAVPSSKEG